MDVCSACRFMPQAIFLGTYVNTDSLHFWQQQMILYAWASYLREDWTWKKLHCPCCGMAVCALSYYNAYGCYFVVFSFFCLTILLGREAFSHRESVFFLSRGMVIAGVTILLIAAGGLSVMQFCIMVIVLKKICAECAEKYAQKDYRPSLYPTPEKLKWSWKDIIFYQDPGWYHNWALTVCVSFIGTFGLMEIYMPYAVSKMYIVFFCSWNIKCFSDRRIFNLPKDNVDPTEENGSR